MSSSALVGGNSFFFVVVLIGAIFTFGAGVECVDVDGYVTGDEGAIETSA